MPDKRVPVSRSVRWRRLRLHAVPIASVALAVVACGWLWRERGAAVYGVGEVDALRIDVTSPTTGVITALPHRAGGQWTLYDHVLAGDVLARFDDRQPQIDGDLLRQEVAQLVDEISQWETQSFAESDESVSDAVRAAGEHERTRLAALEQAPGDRAVAAPLESPEDAAANGELPAGVSAATRIALARLRHVRNGLELRWKELRLQSEMLEIRAPISGTLIAVYCWPGQTVHQGALVATIAADHGRHIVSYVPEDSSLAPSAGMRVTVRPRMVGGPRLASEVEQVGRQIRRVPDHQLGSTAVRQWGLPVRIKLPTEGALQPGALVDVVFHRPKPQ